MPKTDAVGSVLFRMLGWAGLQGWHRQQGRPEGRPCGYCRTTAQQGWA